MAHDPLVSATADLLTSFRSRRTFLKAAAAGVAATGLSATAVDTLAAPRKHNDNQDAIVAILTVARTAEQLAVTFYSNGIANADLLGFGEEHDLDQLKAALIEEQIHLNFFAANGGQSLADTFSFPAGADTFADLQTFIATQQQLEGVFDSAFLAAIKEFADLGESRLAQIAGQIACIESEHRALGRDIADLEPADNWAFAPALIARVADAPGIVAAAGYLSPTEGNSYQYQETDFTDPSLAPIYDRIMFRTPDEGLGSLTAKATQGKRIARPATKPAKQPQKPTAVGKPKK